MLGRDVRVCRRHEVVERGGHNLGFGEAAASFGKNLADGERLQVEGQLLPHVVAAGRRDETRAEHGT